MKNLASIRSLRARECCAKASRTSVYRAVPAFADLRVAMTLTSAEVTAFVDSNRWVAASKLATQSESFRYLIAERVIWSRQYYIQLMHP